MLLGASWCSELAPGSVGTGTSSDPAPCPCSGMRQGVWCNGKASFCPVSACPEKEKGLRALIRYF